MRRPRWLLVSFVLGCSGLALVAFTLSQSAAHVLSRLLDRPLDRVLPAQSAPPIEAHYDPPPYPNPYWLRTAWFLDPSNTSTCASDDNDCGQSTCGPGHKGPCVHWSRIARLWGNGFLNYSPQSNVDVTFNLMSSQVDVDPIIFRPIQLPAGDGGLVNGQTYLFLGTKSAAATTTISSVTQKAPLTPTLFSVTLGTAPTKLQLINNTTHASNAWVAIPTTVTSLTQPVAPMTSPGSGGTIGLPSEVNTWANGDSVTLYNLPTWTFSDVEPVHVGLQGGSVTIIQNVAIPENTSIGVQPGDDPVILGDGVQLVESYVERNVQSKITVPAYTCSSNTLNSSLQGNFNGGAIVAQAPGQGGTYVGKTCSYFIAAGDVQGAFSTMSTGLNNVALCRGVQLHSRTSAGGLPFMMTGYNYAGEVVLPQSSDVIEVPNGGTVDARNTGNDTLNEPGLIWGNGKINAFGGQVLYLAAGIDAGALGVGTLEINGGTTGCCTNTTTIPAQVFCGPVTQTNLGVTTCSDAGLNNQAAGPLGGGFQGF